MFFFHGVASWCHFLDWLELVAEANLIGKEYTAKQAILIFVCHSGDLS
jgi:hypothetical protein